MVFWSPPHKQRERPPRGRRHTSVKSVRSWQVLEAHWLGVTFGPLRRWFFAYETSEVTLAMSDGAKATQGSNTCVCSSVWSVAAVQCSLKKASLRVVDCEWIRGTGSCLRPQGFIIVAIVRAVAQSSVTLSTHRPFNPLPPPALLWLHSLTHSRCSLWLLTDAPAPPPDYTTTMPLRQYPYESTPPTRARLVPARLRPCQQIYLP